MAAEAERGAIEGPRSQKMEDERTGNARFRVIAQAGAEFDTPVTLGVLTCDNIDQAAARAGGTHGNKGWDAALAALEMADLLDRLNIADEG